MRKLLLFFSAILLTINVWGQWSTTETNGKIYYNGGYVGIGTTNPDGLLEIYSPVRKRSVIFNEAGSIKFKYSELASGGWAMGSYFIGYDGTLFDGWRALGSGSTLKYLYAGGSYSAPHFVIKPDGKVGIGTTSPDAKLETYLSSSGKALSLIGKNKDIELYIGHSTRTTHGFYWKYVGTRSGNLNDLELWSQNMSGDDKLIYQVHQNGNLKFGQKIGIACEGGTNGYNLAVKGTIGCGEVIVEDVKGWADFVFEPDYNLMSLSELDNFIQENKHLPEIPTTEEVEENGISVGEMNAKLLQKIEELSLYVIELQKQNEQQNKEIEILKKSMNK